MTTIERNGYAECCKKRWCGVVEDLQSHTVRSFPSSHLMSSFVSDPTTTRIPSPQFFGPAKQALFPIVLVPHERCATQCADQSVNFQIHTGRRRSKNARRMPSRNAFLRLWLRVDRLATSSLSALGVIHLDVMGLLRLDEARLDAALLRPWS